MPCFYNFCNVDAFHYLKSLDDNAYELILTDPPYCISRETGFENAPRTGTSADKFINSFQFGEWDKKEIDLEKLCEEFYRVAAKSSTVIIFYDLWKLTKLRTALENAGFGKIRFGEWIKSNPLPLNSKLGYLTNCREIFVCATKGKGTFNSEYDNGIYNYGLCNDKGRFHPTQKPLALIKDLIEKHSNPKDHVLDVFSGSGTTAVACAETDRYFYGCEANEDYYEKAVNRISDAKAKFNSYRKGIL